MNLQIKYNSGETHITVLGELEDYKQVVEIEKLLNNEKNNHVYITFLEVNVLHKDIIEKIFILQQEEKCTVSTNRRYLFSYFYSLGIKSKLVAEVGKKWNIVDDFVSLRKEIKKEEVYEFLKELNNIYGYDYTEYQIDSIIRRINMAMTREGIYDFDFFRKQVLNKEEIFHNLFLDFSINTTEFFRNPEVFALIKNRILPYLNSYNHIKIWCAGCSNGKEVYSLAIMLEEAGMLNKTQIYATDINPYIIEEAKNGLYSMNSLDNDVKNYRRAGGKNSFIQYFDINKKYIKFKESMMKNILFFQHSLLSVGRLNEFNLILCRNVFIYFDNSLQEKILKSFYNSLDNNGFLVLGNSEGITNNNGKIYFSKYDERYRIYKKAIKILKYSNEKITLP